MPLYSNTIPLVFEFRTIDGGLAGQLVDPVDIVFRAYDYYGKQIGEDVPLTADHRQEKGLYQYLYTLPEGEGTIIVEVTARVGNRPIRDAIEIPLRRARKLPY